MFNKINEWLAKEKELGSLNPDRMVLSTVTKNNIPHSRIVAVREINDKGILFFTQRDTRKVSELINNPRVSLVLWLPLQQRQIVIEGLAHALSDAENQQYWKTMPHDRQLRFTAYAPTSGQCIHSIEQIEEKYQQLVNQYSNIEIPMSDFYRGFRVESEIMYFYTLGITNFSEVMRASRKNDIWAEEIISP
jgi:pyridoxamine 5'-phosphate oxidase